MTTNERSMTGGASGAAMTEFVVLTAVSVPLFFGIPMIGKLIDLRQTSIQASRYTAWEATVAAELDGAPGQLRERFFGDPGAAIRSTPGEIGTHHLWGDPGAAPPVVPAPLAAGRRAVGAYAPYEGGWPAMSAIGIDGASVAGEWHDGAGPGGVARKSGRAIDRAGKLLGGSLGLSADGMVGAGVQVGVRENAWLGAGGDDCGGFACMRENAMILADGWSAGSQLEVEQRVKELVPARKLEFVGDVLQGIGTLPFFDEFDGLGMPGGGSAFGHVDVTQLPANERREITPAPDAVLDYYEGGGR